MFVQPLSHPTSMKSKRKVVSFESSAPKVVVLPATNEAELRSKWYSKQEYAEFKASMIKTIAAIDAGNCQQANMCTRGLEFMTQAGLRQKKQTKVKVLAAVWNGQVRQWNEQNRIYDPVSIALSCQQETLQCVHLAWTLGQLDQQDAIKEYQSMLFSNLYQQQANRSINHYSGGALYNQSNAFIGGDLQKMAGEQSLSNQAVNSGDDLKKCPVESLARKRTSTLDGSAHGPLSKKVNVIAA